MHEKGFVFNKFYNKIMILLKGQISVYVPKSEQELTQETKLLEIITK